MRADALLRFSPVRQPPALAFLSVAAPFCGGGWKVFRVVIPGVITPRGDESKIPRCKCDRPLNGGSPNGFRLFAQPGFFRIYRLPFGKLLRKFVNFGGIFIKHLLIIIIEFYIKLTDLMACCSTIKLNNLRPYFLFPLHVFIGFNNIVWFYWEAKRVIEV